MNIQRNIITILRNLRKELGLSQNEFSKRLGISQTHYANIENGVREPNLDIVQSLIMDFEIPPSKIFSKELESIENEVQFATKKDLLELKNTIETLQNKLQGFLV